MAELLNIYHNRDEGYNKELVELEKSSISPANKDLITRWQNSLFLSWNPVVAPDLAYYEVYRTREPFSDAGLATRVAAVNKTTYQDDSLASSTAYYYAIVAVDSMGNHNLLVISKGGLVADTIPPSPVTGLTVTAIPGQAALSLAWEPCQTPDFAFYKIYRQTTSFADVSTLSPIAETNDSSHADTGLLDSKTYYYGIITVDITGNENYRVYPASGETADLTPPQITLIPLPSEVSGRVTISAQVSDAASGLMQPCEVCFSLDGNCDDEWTSKGIASQFKDTEKTGTCAYVLDATAIMGGAYSYAMRVKDAMGHVGMSHVLQTNVLNVTEFSMAVEPGWNLISLPLSPLNSSTLDVLASLGESYQKIYYYDSFSRQWSVYNPRRGLFDPANTLNELGPGRAYWLQMSAPGTLAVRGYGLQERVIELSSEWNYIGYPYLTQASIAGAIGQIADKTVRIYAYDAKLQRWTGYSTVASLFEPNTIDTFMPGVGYAMYMTSSALWTPQ